MRRFLSLVLALILILGASLSLSACASEHVKTLKVYNWGEYISDGSLGSYETNAEFEKYYYETFGEKVRVVYSTYTTNEDMYAKISSGAGNYDIIIPSDYMIQKMANEGLLLEFNPAEELSNYKYIDDEFKGLYYDPEDKYSVAYTYGTVGIIYNTTLIDAEDVADESWGLLWNPKYKGKILQFNNPRDAFGSAMFYKNLDINAPGTDTATWQAALDQLLIQKPLVQSYVSDEIFNKMISASAAAAAYYAGDYLTMVEQNENLAFYHPKEGTNVFVDAMCIPKSAPEPQIAKRYIDFMLSKDAAVANAMAIGYASPNSLVYTDEEYLDYMGEEGVDILYSSSINEINAAYDHDPSYHSFDQDTHNYVNSLWEELKTDSSTELWVHLASGAIVIGVIGLASYTIYIRKKRSCSYRMRDKALKEAKITAQKTVI